MTEEKRNQVRQEIARLHERGKGDWQGLSKQVLKNFKPLQYNLPQIIAAKIANQKRPIVEGKVQPLWMFLEWGRGTGKTTYLGHHTRQLTHEMPRSNGMFIGPTYQKILTQIMPSMIQGLEMQGLFQNLHYFIGRYPPKSWKWPMPYQPPKRPGKYVFFYTGAGFNLISHDVTGDGRGLNTDWEVGDESALLDKSKLDENTSPTRRGSNKAVFQKSNLFVSRMHVSSTPLTAKGRWFTEMEEAAMMSPEKIKFISADCRFNKENLSDTYLEDAKEGTLPWVYDAEYLNIRPKQVKDGFYPLLDEDVHTYDGFDYNHYHQVGQSVDCRGDGDLRAGLPLILGVDWGATINCLVVNQHYDRELRALKSMFVLGDEKKIQDDLFDDFHNYYKFHKTKTIYLWYDNTGNNQTGITRRTRAQTAKKQLESLGWTVILMTVGGRNPQYGLKQTLWNAILKESNSRLPVYRVNRSNCRDLWISMFNAQAKKSRTGVIEKDKGSERRDNSVKRQHATDLSDAMDTVVYGMFKHLLHNLDSSLPGLHIKKH
jgi:hypothetical protein